MQNQKADLKWFGEGFDGFPKALPEDCVEYAIYLIDSKVSDLAVREKLRKVQSTATQLSKELLKDYLWQRESFQLNLGRDKGRSLLHGRTNYGDSVEDEWLIVYILRELSKQHSDIWIRVFDTDGEFLLIEAANALPLWLNPEVADCRVWINEGRLLIIPIDNPGGTSRQTQTVNDTIGLNTALNIIESPTAKILHSTKIEEEAFYRLRKYPQQIADSLHHSLIKVPRKLAYILHDSPAHISPAIEAFYLRDPIALRPLNAKSKSKLVFPPEDLVTISTKFNKVGFAQLKSQHFSAPPSWVGVPLAKGDAKGKARAEMGMKITCGFEMLMSDPQNRDNKAYREISMLLEDVNAGEAHLPFDNDIREWGMRDDDEGWLDINFEDLEKELNGKTKQNEPYRGFGDQGAQDNLRKMVSRFEEFLDDDKAGVDGAEFLDEMDHDNDSSEVSESEESEDDDGEAKDLSFDEDEFTAMMREMMGMPADVMSEMMGQAKNTRSEYRVKPVISTPSIDDATSDDIHGSNVVTQDREDEEIHQAMEQIEQELRASGALDLESTGAGGIKALPPDDAIDPGSVDPDECNAKTLHDGSADPEVANVDTTLVKNMLESFKSQGGAAGPGGNLLGLMGMHLPRDEHVGGPNP